MKDCCARRGTSGQMQTQNVKRTLVDTKTPGKPSKGSNPGGGVPIWSFFGHSMAYHHRHSNFCARNPLLVS